MSSPPPTLDRFESLDAAGAIDLVRDAAGGNAARLREILVSLGDACERLAAGEPPRARVAAERVARVASVLGDGSASARAKRALVAALAYGGMLEDAVACAADARATAEAAGDPVEAARADVASLHALAKLGRTDEAVARGSIARDALLAARRPDLAARAELNLANIRKIRGEEREAMACLERALEGIPSGESAARGTVLNTLGETLLQLDRFEDAARSFDEAEQLLEGLPLARAVVLGNRADLRAREGRLGEALRDFARASDAVRTMAPGHHARLALEESEALVVLGSPAEALEAVERALGTANEKGLKAELARGLLVRARIHGAAGRIAPARADAAQAAAIAESMGDARTQRSARMAGSELSLRTGDAEAALRDAREGASGASPLDAARAAVHEARARLALGEKPRAAQIAADARRAAADLSVATVEIDAAVVEADALRALGQAEAAIASLERATGLSESLRAALPAERHRAAFTSSRLRAYEDLALDLLARGDDASLGRAFAVVERARSRTLLDTMLRAVDRTSIAAPGTTTDELASLRARLSALHATIGRSAGEAAGERRGSLPAAIDEMRSIERAIDDLVTREASAGGLVSMLAAPATTAVDAARIMAALEPGDALVSYFTAGEELVAFTACDGRLGCVRAIAHAADIVPLVDKLLFALRAGVREPEDARGLRRTNALLRAVADAVVAPVLETLTERADSTPPAGIRRLVIVPHGALHAVPFAALPVDGQPLVARFEIHQAPSASVLCAPARPGVQRAPSAARAPMLVVGHADEDAPLIDREVAAIAANAGGATRCETIVGAAATIARVRDALPGRRTVHLACHGRFVPALPSASGLRLADGWMPVRDILDVALDADLVFLSGCETGRVAIDAGDEVAGLSRAFLAAGARRLVTSLWPVRDAAAAALATGFHTRFSSGMRPSAALRESMLDSMHAHAHPARWAPFVVSGVLP